MNEVEISAVYYDKDKYRLIAACGDSSKGYEFNKEEDAESVRDEMIRGLEESGFKVKVNRSKGDKDESTTLKTKEKSQTE